MKRGEREQRVQIMRIRSKKEILKGKTAGRAEPKSHQLFLPPTHFWPSSSQKHSERFWCEFPGKIYEWKENINKGKSKNNSNKKDNIYLPFPRTKANIGEKFKQRSHMVTNERNNLILRAICVVQSFTCTVLCKFKDNSEPLSGSTFSSHFYIVWGFRPSQPKMWTILR